MQPRFRDRAEHRTFHAHIRAARVHRRVDPIRNRQQQLAQAGAIRLMKLNVHRDVVVKKRRHAPAGFVDCLIHDHQIARFDLFAQRPDRTACQDSCYAELLEREDVCTVGDLRRIESMAIAVSRQRRNFNAVPFNNANRAARASEGGVNVYVAAARFAEKCVAQAGSADESDHSNLAVRDFPRRAQYTAKRAA